MISSSSSFMGASFLVRPWGVMYPQCSQAGSPRLSPCPSTHPLPRNHTMKAFASFLIAACAICTGASAQDNHTPAERSTLLPSHLGLHLATWHSTDTMNNTNPGLYARWADATGTGPVVGSYYNSERSSSLYAAYSRGWQASRLPVSAAITAGVVSGYSAGRVLPLLVPSAALHLGSTALRLTYIPKVEKKGAHALHLSVEVAL